jgi:imidazolonepropionase-like amidohydrolase
VGRPAAQPGATPNPRSAIVVRSAEEGRAAVREHIEQKGGSHQAVSRRRLLVQPTGEDQYQTTYPLAVLQAIIDETHKSGRKAGCHVYGGEGLQNAITAGCDTIEHGYGLRQPQLDEMAAKGIAYDVTFARYSSPYMDDNDAKNTGGKYRIVPIYERAMKMAIATPKLAVLFGTGVDGTFFPHGTNTVELEKLVKQGGMTTARAIQSATITNATMMGWQNEVGSIAVGKFADLAAVSGDPLADITELQRVAS